MPAEFVARRQEVVGKLRTLETQVKTITDFLSNADNVKLLKQDKAQNQAFLASEFNIGAWGVCVGGGGGIGVACACCCWRGVLGGRWAAGEGREGGPAARR